MAKKEQTALTKPEEQTALANAYSHDPLAAVMGDEELLTTGTETVGAKLRLPAYVLNTKFTPPGEDVPVPPNVFLNTVSETTAKKLRLQVLTADRGREWSEVDDATGKRETRCKSYDGLMGNLRTPDGGTVERACKGCPDYAWKRVDGRNTRACGDTLRVVAIDLDTADVCVLPLRKTAVKPFDEYYQREFFRKRPGQTPTSPRRDVPFFAFETLVDAQMLREGNFTWAQARFARGELLSRDAIKAGEAGVVDYRDTKRQLVDDAVETAASHDATGFDFGANTGDKFADPNAGMR